MHIYIMQGRKDLQPKMLYQVQISDLVPADNFYRKLSSSVDLNFLYSHTAKYYGSEGQESIDPVVFFKICLVGYLNNINSDRRLIEYCSNCLDVRLYLKYDIDESLPWHSTISRTRQLYGEEVFLELFKKILSLCVEQGMVRGKRQAIDSAFVKANASLDSIVEKEILDDVEDYAQELDEESEYRINQSITPEDKRSSTITSQKKKSVDQQHAWKKEEYKDMPGHHDNEKNGSDDHENRIRPKFLSNHTHYSPTDPDARISVKPGKARQMNYYAQIAVDDSHHVITGAGADFADKRDSECLPHILDQTINNLKENKLTLEQLLADTGFSSGEVLRYCESKNIEAYIPNFGLYKQQREGFIYNQEKDQYECIRGNRAVLPFRHIKSSHDRHTMKLYRSNNSKCKNCPLRSTCIGKSDFKKIEHSIYKPEYDAMYEKLQTPYAKKIFKKRGSTVEPVLGTMLNFLNLKRVNTRGIKGANKHVLMSALTYNLKKLLKWTSKKLNAQVKALTPPIEKISIPAFYHFINSHIATLYFSLKLTTVKRASL